MIMEGKIEFLKENILGAIRVVEVKGELHFVAKDVAAAIGQQWHAREASHVPREWQGIYSLETDAGPREVITLSEEGLYFFIARSSKPDALPLQKWIIEKAVAAARWIPTRTREGDRLAGGGVKRDALPKSESREVLRAVALNASPGGRGGTPMYNRLTGPTHSTKKDRERFRFLRVEKMFHECLTRRKGGSSRLIR